MRTGRRSPEFTVELASDGSAGFPVAGISIEGAASNYFSKQTDTCTGKILKPGDRCSIRLVYQPPVEGSHRAQISVQADAEADRTAIPLVGSGVSPRLVLRKQRLEFGSVYRTLSGTDRLELANSGTASLRIESLVVAENPLKEFRVARTDCTGGGPLRPRDTCIVEVLFSPVVDGARTATLVISHDAAGGATRVQMTGRGLSPIDGFQISPLRGEFGTVEIGAWSDIATFNLQNPGQGPLTLQEVALRGPAAADYRLVPGSCAMATAVAPRADCTIGVRFQPTAIGERSATLEIRHDAPDGSDTIPLRGVGRAGDTAQPPGVRP